MEDAAEIRDKIQQSEAGKHQLIYRYIRFDNKYLFWYTLVCRFIFATIRISCRFF